MTRPRAAESSETHVDHRPLIRAFSSIGSEPSEWIGHELHTHQPVNQPKDADNQPAGYLGPTSYSAILREHKMENATEDLTSHSTTAFFREYQVAKPLDSGPYNLEAQEHVDQGIRVLQKFPEKSLSERFINHYYDVGEVIVPESVVSHVHKSI